MFIAGYGRSGSTLLCAILGGLENTVSVGELSRIFRYYKASRKCACSKELSACEFWKAVMDEFTRRVPDISIDEADDITTRVESYNNWFLLKFRNSEIEANYRRVWTNMLDAIFEISGKSVIVDASKSSSIACNRVAALSRIANLSQVHLVRDPRAVTSSTLEAQKRRLERHGIKPAPMRAARTLASWFSTNVYIHICVRLGLMKVDARTSYESLTNNPVTAFEKLGKSLGIGMTPIIDKIGSGDTFPADHIFSGDLQRMHGDYAIKQIAAKWPNVLSRSQVLMCSVTYPLARSYGYFRGSGSGS